MTKFARSRRLAFMTTESMKFRMRQRRLEAMESLFCPCCEFHHFTKMQMELASQRREHSKKFARLRSK